eukprot:GEMP01014306.1.p1 GENE.GEMP01014306.1~~GEMP01014306.1.p1  ORF type:complete len:669 (+),score=135.17 GEMP01014306.1:265-2271(+)
MAHFLLVLALRRVNVWAYLDLERFTQTPKALEIECKEVNCGHFVNESFPIVAPDSLNQCVESAAEPLAEFHKEMAFLSFADAKNTTLCREYVCLMYQKLSWNMRPDADPGYYDGCDAFANYNATLCMTVYPDVPGYCDCLWMARERFPGNTRVHQEFMSNDCYIPIVDYLLVGRFLRIHPKMAANVKFDKNFMLGDQCLRAMCEWFSNVATPFVEDSEDKHLVPGICEDLQLPTEPGQCEIIQALEPYHPCPWVELKPNDTDPELLFCFKDRNCFPDDSGFSCCYPEGRMKCPGNKILCDYPRDCAGSTDFCCRDECDERKCSPMLVPWLPEWHGTVDDDTLGFPSNWTYTGSHGEVVILEDEKPIFIESVDFGLLWIVVIICSVILLFCVKFALWQIVYDAFVNQKIARNKTALELFGFNNFVAHVGRKVKRNVFKLPPAAKPTKEMHNTSIMLFNKNLRKIAPVNEFRPHKGLPTQVERQVTLELDDLERKKAVIREKMKTSYDPLQEKKEREEQAKTDGEMERRIKETLKADSVEQASEFYNKIHSPTKGGDMTPSMRLVNQAELVATTVINNADHAPETLFLDRWEGTLKLCPEGVTRLTGRFDEDGGSIFVGGAGNAEPVPVGASKPVCKFFQTGACKQRNCPWLHIMARPGDRLREPVRPKG